jgi:lactoylglutathione lyase
MASFTAVGHVGLSVTDLERSSAFYRRVLGLQLVGEGGGDGHPPYCFLGWDGRAVVTLWQQGRDAFVVQNAGLHHLCFRVDSIAEVQALETRLRETGRSPLHGGIVPHGEGLDSGGLFFLDPDGIQLEVSTAAGAGKRPAPVRGAPTCGFF